MGEMGRHSQYVETTLSRELDLSADRAKYDNNAKKLLSNKPILAWILKYTCKDLSRCEIHEIESYIEGEISISGVSVMPGETSQKIVGNSTEKEIAGEGKVFFDLLFRVRIPEENTIRTYIVNIEAQKSFYPGYPLEKRGIFYCAREISSQMGIVFEESDYGKIQKVYSIWICMNAPDKYGNFLVHYDLEKTVEFGTYPQSEAHDLITVALIGLNEKVKKESDLHKLLNVLFSDKMLPADKKVCLEEEFQIPVTRKMEGEMQYMCNISDVIVSNAIQEGIEIGIERGQVDSIRNLMDSLGISMEKAMTLLKIAETEQGKYAELLSK